MAQGVLSDHLRYTTFTPGPGADEGSLKINLPGQNKTSKKRLIVKEVEAVHQLLSQKLPAFRDSMVCHISPRISQREGPRLKGGYTLTAADILSGQKFSDCACQGAWPIEMWEPGQGLTLRYLKNTASYDIPQRCLASPDIANLFAAGLLLSTDREAQGSTRVMGTCLATGEQAALLACRYL